MNHWSHQDAESLYNIPHWGGGYFGTNAKGHLVCRPDGAPDGRPSGPSDTGDAGGTIDLFELVAQIRQRGLEAPILLRFEGILRARVREIQGAFDQAREEYDYGAPYTCVFPIKVNQQRHLVDVLLQEDRRAPQGASLGIEVGSKPELLAVLALYSGRDRLVICNGYKDSEYVETALLTSRLGNSPVLVIEKPSELETVLRASEKLGIRPIIGVRTKLGLSGSGRWKDSGGDRSKFGLTTRQIVCLVERLQEEGMLDCLRLLHFHIGSQITHIRAIKRALGEATRTLVSLVEMGAPIEWFDVGGGLGVDYDGSSTDFDSSMNYTVQEYANDVVFSTKQACAEAEIPEPKLLSESGRALTAHHAVLITEVLGVTDFSSVGIPAVAADDEPETIRNFAAVCAEVSGENFQESYHDAMELREEGMTLFRVGQLTLSERARVEEFFWRTCEKILRITRTLEYVPDDLGHLERDMADTYFLNFSVFQSMPDAWAIQQLFPVLPIHRLNEEPTRRATLADITCDSDGKIDRFIDQRDEKSTLELHPFHEGESYYLGFFLVGAYQEILGDMHNLFGDTHVVHVDLDAGGKPRLTHFVPGDKTEEVLSYMEYFKGDLTSALRRSVESAIEEDRMTVDASAMLLRRLEEGLASYTYLVTKPRPEGAAPSP